MSTYEWFFPKLVETLVNIRYNFMVQTKEKRVFNMNDFIKLLDKNLEYIEHEITNDTINIWVKSVRKEVICPYCNRTSTKVHSHYQGSFQDLPIQNKKVIIFINNRKMFCNNPKCNYKTFAETYDFLSSKGKKSRRLEDEIMNIAMNVSSIAASNILNKNIAKVGKSTICNLLKKKKNFKQG